MTDIIKTTVYQGDKLIGIKFGSAPGTKCHDCALNGKPECGLKTLECTQGVSLVWLREHDYLIRKLKGTL